MWWISGGCDCAEENETGFLTCSSNNYYEKPVQQAITHKTGRYFVINVSACFIYILRIKFVYQSR